METLFQRYGCSKPMGEDVFGAHRAAQEEVVDTMNKDLFLTTLNNYVRWSTRQGHFHPEMQRDLTKINRARLNQYAGAGAGILFAGTVWNPNFVKRRSWYMRKIAVVGWGLVGFSLGRRYYED